MGKNRTLRYLDPACGNFMRFWQQKAPPLPPEAGYHFANTSLRGQFGKCELVGAQPLHLAIARPFCRLKAPLGLSLLHFVLQTRTCRSETPPFCLRKNVLSLKHPAGVFVASANANLSGHSPSILLAQKRSVACTPHWGFHCFTSFRKREFGYLLIF